jgi:hypothetical protein
LLRAFGENGSDQKLRISGRILRIFQQMLAVLHFVFLSLLVTEGSNKKFKTDYENLVHVFLSRVGGPDWGGGGYFPLTTKFALVDFLDSGR